jgi:hypothetical protein
MSASPTHHLQVVDQLVLEIPDVVVVGEARDLALPLLLQYSLINTTISSMRILDFNKELSIFD